jgi:hypothetical protein
MQSSTRAGYRAIRVVFDVCESFNVRRGYRQRGIAGQKGYCAIRVVFDVCESFNVRRGYRQRGIAGQKGYRAIRVVFDVRPSSESPGCAPPNHPLCD